MSLIDRFKDYPPLLQWTLVIVVIVFVITMWFQFVWGTAKQWDEQAHQYEAAIAKASKTASEVPPRTESVIVALGDKQPLAMKAASAADLTSAIASVLADHQVEGTEIKEKSSIKFARTEMMQLLPPGMEGEKLVTEVRFEATQEEAYAVIAALERHPSIETITSVQVMKKTGLRPNENKAVVVRATVEAWALSPRSSASAGGGRTVNP